MFLPSFCSYGGPYGLDKDAWREVCKIKCNHPSSANQCVVMDSGQGVIAWTDNDTSGTGGTGVLMLTCTISPNATKRSTAQK